MKLPKIRKTFCPHCKKHTEHKVLESKKRTVGSAHPMSYGSKTRAKLRGYRGFGNLGRYSRPPVSRWKMAGKKQSKIIDLRFECIICKKKHNQRKGFRAKKVEFV